MNVQIDNTQSGADEDNKERLLRTLMQEEKAKRKEQSTEWNATLYAWGRGDVGLPEGEEEVAWEPRPLLSLSGLRPVSVSCSGKHSAMATSTGDIYTWGLNSSGQLGHGDMTDRSAPLVVKSLALVKVLQHTKFVQVATGEDHTVALTGKKKHYRNTHTQ